MTAALRTVEDPRRPRDGFPVRLDLARLAEREPAPREWIVEGVIPCSANVLLAAHGGSGKTLLALHLAVCIATGLPFYGVPTTRGVVVALFAEDDADELHRRLSAVCADLGVDMASLVDWLYLYDGVGCDVSLFSRRAIGDDGRTYSTAEPDVTDTFNFVRAAVQLYEAKVLVLDSVSDCYDADENVRPQVRRYLSRTLGLVLPRRGAVVHVAHVDKASARGASTSNTYTGSTAWHNSCRSRLALRPIRPDEGDGQRQDDGRRELVVEKANYGRPGLTIPLRYDEDRRVFVRDGAAGDGGMVGVIRDRSERRGVLKALLEAATAGRSVSTARQANNNAGAILAPLASLPAGLKSQTGRRRLVGILLDLEAAGMIEREVYTTPTRNQSERWRVTSAGMVEAG
jgi:RecA-family ATPase